MEDYYIKDKKKRSRGLLFNLVILLIMLITMASLLITNELYNSKNLKDGEVPSVNNVNPK